MRNNTAYEKRSLARRRRHELARAAKVKALRRVTGAWKPGKCDGSDPITPTQWRRDHRVDSDPSVIRRSKFKRPGVLRKEA